MVRPVVLQMVWTGGFKTVDAMVEHLKSLGADKPDRILYFGVGQVMGKRRRTAIQYVGKSENSAGVHNRFNAKHKLYQIQGAHSFWYSSFYKAKMEKNEITKFDFRVNLAEKFMIKYFDPPMNKNRKKFDAGHHGTIHSFWQDAELNEIARPFEWFPEVIDYDASDGNFYEGDYG